MDDPFPQISNDDYLALLMARGIQTDHLLYGLYASDGYMHAEHIADQVVRQYLNPDWKSDPKFDDYWKKYGR